MQIAELWAHLLKAGRRVELRTFWDDAASVKWIREAASHTVFGGDKGVGTPEAPIRRRDKDIQTPLMTMIRLGIYLVDAVSLRSAVRAALRSGADYVVFDRYIYDELANLNLRNSILRLYMQAILKLVPRPQMVFVLDAEPAQAHARKPEYPLKSMFVSRNAYLRLAAMLPSVTVIPPMPPEQVTAMVVECVSSCSALWEQLSVDRPEDLAHDQNASAGRAIGRDCPSNCGRS